MLFDFPSEVYVDELLVAPKKGGVIREVPQNGREKIPAPFFVAGKKLTAF